MSWSLKARIVFSVSVYTPPPRLTLRMRTHYASNERKDQPPLRPYVRICEISTTLVKYLFESYLNFVSRLFFHPTPITCQIVFSVSQLFTLDACLWSPTVVGGRWRSGFVLFIVIVLLLASSLFIPRPPAVSHSTPFSPHFSLHS